MAKSPGNLLANGIIPLATGGSNVNPTVRRAVVDKLNSLGIPAWMKTSTTVLCQHVEQITGEPAPSIDQVNNYLGRWVVSGAPQPAVYPQRINLMQRPPAKPSATMQIALERARQAQPPIRAMTSNVPRRVPDA